MLKKKKTEDKNTDMSENDQLNEQELTESTQQTEISAEDKLKDELAQANDKYLRLYAEFDNFRRRTIKEREEARKLEGKDLFVALLPVLDDFDRALRAMENAT